MKQLRAYNVWYQRKPGKGFFMVSCLIGWAYVRLHGKTWESKLQLTENQDSMWIYPPKGAIFVECLEGRAMVRFNAHEWATVAQVNEGDEIFRIHPSPNLIGKL